MKMPIMGEKGPIYQQIVDYFVSRIASGMLPPGFKLPTVRAFSAENNIAQGTVKHAYDLLEQQGYIKKVQGRGTFVCNLETSQPISKKEQGMETIDCFLDRMQTLNFSPEEIRIYFDLKLRQREGDIPPVHLGAIDCNPEALSVMTQQIAELGHTDVREYLLGTVLDASVPFDPGLDILVTTPTHFDEVAARMTEDQHLAQLVMAISGNTLLELTRIAEEHSVAIICASQRFGQIITNSIQRYGLLQAPATIAYFGQGAPLEELLRQVDQIILPPNYWRFASPEEQDLIQNLAFTAPPILFDYRIERGSMLFLEEQIKNLYQAKLPKK